MSPRLALVRGSSAAHAPARAPGNAIDELCGPHLGKVKRWARRLAGPTADLQDLVHDIFLVALREGFDERRSATVETWLCGITQRVVSARRRKERLRRPWRARPPEENDRLYRALDRLPEAERTTLILYELEELPGDDVARLTGVPLPTVWARLHRARERFMRALERAGGP